MNRGEHTISSTPDEATPRKAYRAPALVIYGKVAHLTQAGSGCSMDDNATCGPVGGNMGPMGQGTGM